MAFHHVALATADAEATVRFYTEAMGFRLVKTVVGPVLETGGRARHFFFDTGGGELMAFWDLAESGLPEGWRADVSTGMGLPIWVNHLAFDAPTLDDLGAARERWQRHGHDVTEIDHGFCASVYAVDPNGILVEFCCTTRDFTDEEIADAPRRLTEAEPALDPEPVVRFHKAVAAARATEPAPASV